MCKILIEEKSLKKTHHDDNMKTFYHWKKVFDSKKVESSPLCLSWAKEEKIDRRKVISFISHDLKKERKLKKKFFSEIKKKLARKMKKTHHEEQSFFSVKSLRFYFFIFSSLYWALKFSEDEQRSNLRFFRSINNSESN